jgi:hypothetical protein
MLHDAGYANERLVLLHAHQSMPCGRLSPCGYGKGDWLLLIANAPAADHLSPMVARLVADIQGIALADVLYVPLGHYVQKSAWRSNVSGVLKASASVFWNIAKS